MKILGEILANQWAIVPSALDSILEAANHETVDSVARLRLASEAEYKAITADLGQKVEGAFRAYKSGNVGVIDINGPIVPRATFFAWLFGATSVERISADLRLLEADNEITDIILFSDTPGGSVVGMSDFAKQIKASNKTITTFVFGQLASAGYWYGAASNRIVASDTGLIGSVGVVATVSTDVEPGVTTIISTQSPKKNVSPTTPEGRQELQRLVDKIAAVCIESIAANRGISVDEVLANYGKGAMFTGQEALDKGMIDGVSSFQDLMASLQRNSFELAAAGGKTTKGTTMDLKTLKAEFPEVFEAAVKIGIATERKNVEAHLKLGAASGDMETAHKAIVAGDSPSDVLVMASYNSASMLKSQALARTGDNPEGLTGSLGEGVIVPPKAKEDKIAAEVADLVSEGMSFYGDDGGLA